MRFSFAECAIDLATRQVVREGLVVPVPPKAFDLLALLIEERPRAVSKQEIHERLWPGTFVTQSNLSSLMADLRTALGDEARRPRFVRTVHGFGYAFCGTVDADAAPAAATSPGAFRLYCQDREIALREGENLLGRTDDAVVWIDAPTVSRRHARVVIADGKAVLEDLGSRNGTWLRGERITAAAPLTDGDEFRVGRVPVRFRAVRAMGTTRSASGP